MWWTLEAGNIYFFEKVDSVPDISIEQPNDGQIFFSQNVTINWVERDAQELHLYLNGIFIKDVSGGDEYRFERLDEGEYMVEIFGVGSKGHVAFDSVNFTVTKRISMDIIITYPVEGCIHEGEDLTVKWYADHEENGNITYRVRLNDGFWILVGTSTSATFSGLEEGVYSVEVRGEDVFGNRDTCKVNFTVVEYEEDSSDYFLYGLIMALSVIFLLVILKVKFFSK